jgi:ribosomal-protein-alanine N-acetyltransferase
MTAQIKIASLEEALELSHLHERCFAKGWSVAAIEELLASPGCGAFKIQGEDEAQATGFLMYRAILAEVEILTLCIDPEFRQRGFGELLLRHLIAWSQAASITSIFLEVAEDNHPGRALYAAQGFESIGERKNYYKSSAADEKTGAAVNAHVLALKIS